MLGTVPVPVRLWGSYGLREREDLHTIPSISLCLQTGVSANEGKVQDATSLTDWCPPFFFLKERKKEKRNLPLTVIALIVNQLLSCQIGT